MDGIKKPINGGGGEVGAGFSGRIILPLFRAWATCTWMHSSDILKFFMERILCIKFLIRALIDSCVRNNFIDGWQYLQLFMNKVWEMTILVHSCHTDGDNTIAWFVIITAKYTIHTLDAMLKCKNRLDFYPYVADVPLGASDRTCLKFILEKFAWIFVRNPLSECMVT